MSVRRFAGLIAAWGLAVPALLAGQNASPVDWIRANAIRLTTAQAWLTSSAEGQAIEDQLRRLASAGGECPEREATLAWVDRQLATEQLPYEEWEVLYRERLQVERDLLRGTPPGEAAPTPDGSAARQARDPSQPRFRRLAALAINVLVIGLLALDVALLLLNRDGSTGSGPRAARWG